MPVSAAQYALEPAVEGQFTTTSSNRLITGTADNYVNASASGDAIPFARFVVETVQGSGLLDVPSATGQTIIGVTGFVDIYERQSSNPTLTGVPYREKMSVGKVCRVAFKAETAIAFGDTIFVRHTGTPLTRGQIRNDADTANADALPAGTYRIINETSAPNQIVQLEIDLGNTN